MRPVRQYALLAVLFAVAVSSQTVFTVDVLSLMAGEYPARPFLVEEPWPSYRGERILAVDGKPLRGLVDFDSAVRAHKPGERLRVTLERGDIHVPLSKPRDQASPFFAWTAWLFMPTFSILLGFWVAAVRPRDVRAWLMLGILLGFSQMTRAWSLAPLGWGPLVGVPAAMLRDASDTLWGLSMMLFGIYFPQRWSVDRRVPWAKWILLAPSLAMALVDQVQTVARALNYPFSKAFPVPHFPDSAAFFAIAPCIGIFFASIAAKYHDPVLETDDRRRLKLLYWGASVALTPMFLLLLHSILVKGGGPGDASGVALIVALLLLAIFPLTLAYVVVVGRAMDVRVVVRQGLQYALAARGVRVLQGILVVGVILFVATEAGSATVSRPRKIIYVAVGVTLAFLVRESGERLRRWVDRKFFREAYNAELILTELAEQVRGILDAEALIETVRRRISEGFHIERVEVELHGRDLEPSVKHGLVLVLPLAGRKETLGRLWVGGKMSEEPYSPSEIKLLQTVAAQTGLALENARLSDAVAHEIAQREMLNREIEIAREVQQRLFPQNLPEVAALEYAGYCRPARGVGGDYYDFLSLASGRLGLAIADVSGKGIPAALLMASLQASVRGQSQGPAQVAELMTNVNRLICEASPENRYATFFYGQFDPATRLLVYSNGGHNNPIVLRGSEVIRLEVGGPPVGLFKFSRYQQAEVQLEAGDLMVLFTDGVSEAENSAQDEFGEEALIATARDCEGLPAAEVIRRIMERADEFVAGAPQHDDMTLVIARVG